MKILIVHYHLNPGGVTRIIQSQIQSLQKITPGHDIILLCGACDNPEFYEGMGITVRIDQRFNYISGTDFQINLPEQLASGIRHLVSRSDIIHAHNLNLGKNPALTLALHELALEGYRIFNHCHDFAEDRPPNWDYLGQVIEGSYGRSLMEVLYPQLENYKLGVLNLKDLKRLEDYGIPPERSFLLPNPVNIPSEGPGDKRASRRHIVAQLSLNPQKLIVTYPVRVIRRKNIGEFILLAALFHEQASWLVTQDPLNPQEIEPYRKWVDFCKKEGIEILFEAGKKVDFPELMSASDFCISTSVREGFGMVFMEPWLMGTPVIGRNIDYIINDLTNSGILFPRLYDRISIGDDTDFKDLDMQGQMEIIKEARSGEQDRLTLIEDNPGLDRLLDPVPESTIMLNQEVIREKYSLKKYGERLNAIYRSYPA
jgi:glycosyltransferase involved in cell wall biosynthesis